MTKLEALRSDEVRRAGEAPVVDLENYVPAYLGFISNKWSRSASRLYRLRFGIGIESWRIMVLLAIEGRISANRICQVIFMDKASVSRSLKRLSDKGLIVVSSDPSDARLRLAELTASGFAMHDRIIELALAREKALLSCLSEDERRTLMRLLLKVHANLWALDDPVWQGNGAQGDGQAASGPR